MQSEAIKTAKIMQFIINNNGVMWQDDFRREIHKAGGLLRRMQTAAKILRDSGFKLATRKGGEWTQWYIADTPAKELEYQTQFLNDMYSEVRSWVRASGSQVALRVAINIGAELNKTAQQVVRECRPVPLPQLTP